MCVCMFSQVMCLKEQTTDGERTSEEGNSTYTNVCTEGTTEMRTQVLRFFRKMLVAMRHLCSIFIAQILQITLAAFYEICCN